MNPVVTPPVVPPVVPPVTPPVTPPVVPPVETPVVPPVTPPVAIVYDLKLADTSALLPADLTEVLALAKEKNLTNEQAGMLLNQREATAVAVNARIQETYKTTVAKWPDEVRADPEIGGQNFDRTLLRTKLVMDRFAPEWSKFRTLLNESGYGNHPEFVRFVEAIGKLMGEDKGLGGAPGGGGTPGEKLSDEKLFFPDR